MPVFLYQQFFWGSLGGLATGLLAQLWFSVTWGYSPAPTLKACLCIGISAGLPAVALNAVGAAQALCLGISWSFLGIAWLLLYSLLLQPSSPKTPERRARSFPSDRHRIDSAAENPLLIDDNFDVFLTHNSKDKPAVRKIAVALRERGLKVWLDEWELVPGRPWLEATEKAIESSRCAAVLVGRDGLGPWEAPEMRACLSEFISRGLPVIPVLLPGAPDTPLPLFLRQFTWVDLRNGLSSSEGLDRLVWGITGRRPQFGRR